MQTFSMWLQNGTDLSMCLTIEFTARFERFVSYLVNKAVPLCIPKRILSYDCVSYNCSPSLKLYESFTLLSFLFRFVIITLSWEFVYYVPLKSRDFF